MLQPASTQAPGLQIDRARQQEDDHGRPDEEPIQAKLKRRCFGADDNVPEENHEIGDLGA